MTEKPSVRLGYWEQELFIKNDLTTLEKVKGIRDEVVALEAELGKANQLSIKLALQKGGMVDEARTLKAERDRFKQREIELSKGWKRLHSENEDLKSRLAEALEGRNRVGKTFNVEHGLLENGNDCIYTRQQIIGMLSTILGNQFSETMITLRGEAEIGE